MSLIALKFVFAGLFALLLLSAGWLAGELRQLKGRDRRVMLWILAVVLALGLVALVAPIAGWLWWWVFGK